MTTSMMLFASVGLVSALSAVAARGQASAPAPGDGPIERTIDLRRTHAPFGGWGTSLCWWANRVGDWPDDRLDALVRDVTDPVDGLGLTVFRYNIGGGDRPGHDHLRPGAAVPGFKPAPDAPYDWAADARQRRVMLKLVAAVDEPVLEAFANSAPWWMTTSGCAAGSVDGGPNLPAASERAFVNYLADVAAFYRERHAVTFHSVSPFNEPDANWWKTTNNQEGMHVPPEQQARLVRGLRAALDARGLRASVVSANDANNLDAALEALRFYDADALAALGQINAHSYFGSRRVELRELAARLSKPLWQSETGPLHVGGTDDEQVMKTMARLVLDLNEMRPSAWCLWQVSEGGPWGAFHEAKDGVADHSRARTFHALALFTRAVRPGDRLVTLDGGDVLASVSAQRGEAAIFVANAGPTPRDVALTLTGDARWPATATVARNTADVPLATPDPVAVRDGTIRATVPAGSVTRFTLAMPAADR